MDPGLKVRPMLWAPRTLDLKYKLKTQNVNLNLPKLFDGPKIDKVRSDLTDQLPVQGKLTLTVVERNPDRQEDTPTPNHAVLNDDKDELQEDHPDLDLAVHPVEGGLGHQQDDLKDQKVQKNQKMNLQQKR